MKSVSTATRLSISLACLTASVLLAAQSLGLVPDGQAAALKGRKDLCETIAIYCSTATQRNDTASIRQVVEALKARNPQIQSLALRRANGKVVWESEGHRARWDTAKSAAGGAGGRSTSSHVQVPIFQGDKPWGGVEVCFEPLGRSGFLGFLSHPLVRLTAFVAALGFATYLFYLRRTLRHLDPTSVIPERVKAMLDTLTEGVLVLDKRERIVLANDAFLGLSGRTAEQLMGLAVSDLGWSVGANADGTSPAAQADAPTPWTTAIRQGESQKGVALSLRDEAGATRAVTINCSPVLAAAGGTAGGGVRGALLTVDDVTQIEATNSQLRDTLQTLERTRDEIQRQNKELHALATTDPLTGCLNRRSFYTQFQTLWSAARRYDQSIACVMVDVDYFKKINDRHGHSVGDQVLQHVSSILKGLSRDSDVVCRYGGEEFAILLPHADITAAAQAAERYRQAIEANPCGEVSPTASVGVSALHLGAADQQSLLDEADRSLYVAKRTGRNRVVRWDEVRDTPAADMAAKPAEPAAPAAARVHTPIASHAVTALMSALSHRDRRTADHCRRVAELCAATARGLLTAHDAFVLEVAAMLHDIGKLGVPDAVLLKPGPLTPEEWAVMRSHDEMGVEILSAAFGSAQLTDAVRAHHAWYCPNPDAPADPARPTGNDIPVTARILAIADAYDAMVSDRPYRGARAEEEAFAELRRCAGTQFDPELTERFIAVVSGRRKPAPPTDGPGAPTTTTTTTTTSGPGALTVTEEAALRIRLEIERLACAAEARDVAALAQIARELTAIAAGDGMTAIADRMGDVERAANGGSPADLDKVQQLAGELLEACRVPHSFSSHTGAAGAHGPTVASLVPTGR